MPEFLTDNQAEQLMNGEMRSPAEAAKIMKRPANLVRKMLIRKQFPNAFRIRRSYYIPMSDIRDVMTKAGECPPLFDECQGVQKLAHKVEFHPKMPRGMQTRMGLPLAFDACDAKCVVDISLYTQPCIYFLLNDSWEVVYVGKSVNLMSRIGSHYMSGKQFSRFAIYPSSLEALDDDEIRFIEKYRPPLNLVGRNGQRL